MPDVLTGREARRHRVDTGPRFMLLLADALSPKGEWCGPYAMDGAGIWSAPSGTGYRPDYNEWAPHARKLLDKKPA